MPSDATLEASWARGQVADARDECDRLDVQIADARDEQAIYRREGLDAKVVDAQTRINALEALRRDAGAQLDARRDDLAAAEAAEAQAAKLDELRALAASATAAEEALNAARLAIGNALAAELPKIAHAHNSLMYFRAQFLAGIEGNHSLAFDVGAPLAAVRLPWDGSAHPLNQHHDLPPVPNAQLVGIVVRAALAVEQTRRVEEMNARTRAAREAALARAGQI